jgi:hypothetical protein
MNKPHKCFICHQPLKDMKARVVSKEKLKRLGVPMTIYSRTPRGPHKSKHSFVHMICYRRACKKKGMMVK